MANTPLRIFWINPCSCSRQAAERAANGPSDLFLPAATSSPPLSVPTESTWQPTAGMASNFGCFPMLTRFQRCVRTALPLAGLPCSLCLRSCHAFVPGRHRPPGAYFLHRPNHRPAPAKVAMARKLAVSLYRMWPKGFDYQQTLQFGSHAGEPGYVHGVK